MIGLRLTFTAGRYHATPWDHHVNEGVSEWPPAPWRILRALTAASYRLDERERDGVAELLERLTALPVYRLPSSATAHLRHYMPTRSSSAKILDTFVVVGDGARAPADVLVWWPEVELTSAQAQLLGRLAAQIGYLGRAESWVEVAVLDAIDESPNARPLDPGEAPDTGAVRLLAAQTPAELAAWRERWTNAAGKPRKSKSGPSLPRTVWDALNVDTAQLQRERWSQAPGSFWTAYRVDERPRVRPRPRKRLQRGPQGAVFMLDSAVLPSVEQTLPIAERMRSALLRLTGSDEPAPWQFSGKDEHGAPLTGHEHAYVLPIGRRHRMGRELIDRVLIWSPEGLEPQAWADLQRLASSGRRLRGAADAHPLELILAGYGGAAQLEPLLRGDPPHARGSWFGPSRSWVSATPFVPPRHTKIRRGQRIDTPAQQLHQLAEKVLGCSVLKVETIESEDNETFGWNRFVRTRKKDRAQARGRHGYGFRVTFAKDLEGPIALGYGAHFGLGLFRAECE